MNTMSMSTERNQGQRVFAGREKASTSTVVFKEVRSITPSFRTTNTIIHLAPGDELSYGMGRDLKKAFDEIGEAEMPPLYFDKMYSASIGDVTACVLNTRDRLPSGSPSKFSNVSKFDANELRFMIVAIIDNVAKLSENKFCRVDIDSTEVLERNDYFKVVSETLDKICLEIESGALEFKNSKGETIESINVVFNICQKIYEDKNDDDYVVDDDEDDYDGDYDIDDDDEDDYDIDDDDDEDDYDDYDDDEDDDDEEDVKESDSSIKDNKKDDGFFSFSKISSLLKK